MNNKAQFTPGPWAVELRQWDHGASLAIVARHNGWIVAIVPFDEDIQEVDEPDAETVKRHPDDEPNARLIAAAPAMYEALETVPLPKHNEAVGEFYTRFYAWYEGQRKQALAQAEGRQGR